MSEELEMLGEVRSALQKAQSQLDEIGRKIVNHSLPNLSDREVLPIDVLRALLTLKMYTDQFPFSV